MKKSLKLMVLFWLPAILVLTVLSIKKSRGPYYIGRNYDPDYVYLLGSLNAADFKPSKMTYHPGIPVQIIGGLILRIPSPSYADLQKDVLKRPEYYLNRLNYFVICINVILLIILGVVVYFLTGELIAGLIIQIAPFLSNSILFALTRYNPEPFLIFSSTLLILAILIKVLKRNRDNWLFTSIFALIAGFGMAVKVTFFPLLLIPILVFRNLLTVFKYFLLTLITFFAFFIPYHERIMAFLNYLWNVITHKGLHGKGDTGFMSTGTVLPDIERLFLREPIFIFVLVLLIAFVVVNLSIPNLRKILSKNLVFKILIGILAVDIIGLIMFLKHFGVIYLMPIYSLSGFGLMLIYICMKTLSVELKFKFRIVRLSYIFIFILLGFIIYLNLPNFKKMEEKRNEKLKVFQKVLNEYRDYSIISYYGSTSKVYALYFGNLWIGNSHTRELKSLYREDVYVLKSKQKKIYNWEKKINIKELSQNYKKFIIHGPPIFEGRRKLRISKIPREILSESNLKLINTMPNNKYETIFKFESVNPPEKTKR